MASLAPKGLAVTRTRPPPSEERTVKIPAGRLGLASSHPSQPSRAPSGDQAQQARFSVGSGLSSSVNPDPSGLTVAGRSRPPGFATQTRILVPLGDQRGHSATPGRSWTWLVPSGFAVKIWKSPRLASNRPNTIWPFGPGTFAWAGTATAANASSAAAKIVTSVISRLIATTPY